MLSKEITSDLVNGVDYFTLLDKINNTISNEVVKDNTEEVVSMKDALLSAVNNLGDVMTNGSLSGVPTGYPKLDEITGGWLKGNVILFAARPGQGKTITLLEHARCAAELNYNVLFLSLEMPVMSLIYRMISGQLDNPTPYSKIKTGRISIEQFTSVQSEAVTRLEKLPITWYDGANRDVNYLSSMIQKIVREKNIKMVMIDYLQLMTDSTINASNEVAMVGTVADKIQSLAKKLNIPFVCAAQLNRASEGRSSHRPKLSDLRSSGKIEQMASVVVGLYREDYYAYEEARENNNPNVTFNNKLEYIFLKNRDGNTATHDMFVDVATSRISEQDIFNRKNIF
jgi:replicative DNA helicase